jgi:hypothetical protein
VLEVLEHADGPLTFSAVWFRVRYEIPRSRLRFALDGLIVDGTAAGDLYRFRERNSAGGEILHRSWGYSVVRGG